MKDNQNKKNFLKEAQQIDEIIEEYEERLLQAQAWLYARPPFSGVCIRSSALEWSEKNLNYKVLEMESNYLLSALLRLKDIIAQTVFSVPDDNQRQVLTLRYLDHLTPGFIGKTLQRDRKWVWRVEQRALMHMEIPDRYYKTKTNIATEFYPRRSILSNKVLLFLCALDGDEMPLIHIRNE